MDPNPINLERNLTTTTTTTNSFNRHRRKIIFRRRKLPSVRLGGKKARKFALTGVFRRVRVTWLKVKYALRLKKLKKFYRALIRDIIEGSAAVEPRQQMVYMESTFGIPVYTITR